MSTKHLLVVFAALAALPLLPQAIAQEKPVSDKKPVAAADVSPAQQQERERLLTLIALTEAPLLPASIAQDHPAAGPAGQKPASATHASQQHENEGERIFAQNCSRCHNAPEGFSPRISGTIVPHMRVRASLSKHDEEELLKFFNPKHFRNLAAASRATGLYVVFSQRKPHLAALTRKRSLRKCFELRLQTLTPHVSRKGDVGPGFACGAGVPRITSWVIFSRPSHGKRDKSRLNSLRKNSLHTPRSGAEAASYEGHGFSHAASAAALDGLPRRSER